MAPPRLVSLASLISRQPPIALLLATLLFSANAEVYKNVPGAGLVQALGYDLAYTTPVDINGAKGKVYVWASTDSLSRTLFKIQNAHQKQNHPVGFNSDKTTGFGMVVDGKTLVRYLLIASDDNSDHTIVYQTNCALADFQRAAPSTPDARPRHHQLDAIPFPSNATPVSFVQDKNTGMAVEVSTVPNAFALAWFERTMPDNGWHLTMRTTENAQVYVRGKERAMISIAHGEKETTLTRIHHKRGSFFK